MRHWKRSKHEAGFSLIELMVSMTVFGVMLGAVLGGMVNSQQTFRTNEIASNLHQELRAALELMSQEIGQAGLGGHDFSTVSTTTTYNTLATDYAPNQLTSLTAAVTAGAGANICVASTSQMYVGEYVVIDTGAPGANGQESVQITALGSSATICSSANPAYFTAAMATYNHPVTTPPVPVFVQGVYYQGVYPVACNAGVCTNITNSGTTTASFPATSLRIFGDINGNGTLVIVDYVCPTGTGSWGPDSSGVYWGPLIRYEYSFNGTLLSQRNMLDWVAVNNTATNSPGCIFNLIAPPNVTVAANPTTPTTNVYVFVTSVAVTLRAMSGTVVNGVMSTRNDPRTNAPVTLTKSFMNIQPRNILGAYNLAVQDSASYLGTSYLNQPDQELEPAPSAVQTFITGGTCP